MSSAEADGAGLRQGGEGIVMYESNWCGYCRAARRLLGSKGWEYEARSVDGDAAARKQMQERSGRTSVPQIWFGGVHVGGFDDLAALEESGELDSLHAAEVGSA